MKWIRPSGTEIETNDEPGTIQHCESMGWKRAEEEAEVLTEPVPEPEKAQWEDAGEERLEKQKKQSKGNRR